jgi:hypothetical protein
MAVKSASDRNSQDDSLRRTRETYQQKETETAKQNGKKVKQISESHQAEIDQIKQEHERQLEDLKTKTKDAFSRRDMEYQREIDEMRDMHTKQLQRLATDSDSKTERTRQALKAEVERTRTTSEQQRDLLKNTYEDQLVAKDKQLADYSVNSRKIQQESSGQLKERMNNTHKKEIDLLTKDRDQQLLQAERDEQNLRRSKDLQVKATVRSKENEVNRLQTMNQVMLKNEKENARQTAEEQRAELQYGIQKNRERYDKAAQEIRNENVSARDDLSKTVNDRLNDQVISLKAKNTSLKNENVRQRVKLENEKDREVRNVKDALGANIENLEHVRRETLTAANASVHGEIDKINRKSEDAIKNNNQFHNERKSMDDLRNEERYSRTKFDLTKTLDNEKISNEARFDKLKNFNELEQGKMAAYFERASASMKDNFETTLREMRDRNKRDQEQMFSSFTKQAQETDQKFQQKIADVSLSYEKKIADLQENHLKASKDQNAIAERQKNEVAKKADIELKTQASQYEYRISKLQDKHKAELDAANRKFEETLANLTKTRQS